MKGEGEIRTFSIKGDNYHIEGVGNEMDIPYITVLIKIQGSRNYQL